MSDETLKSELAGLRIDRDPEPVRSYRWVGWLIVLALLAIGGVFGWRWVNRERPIEVEAATVTSRPAGVQATVLNASGYVTARRRATVSSKITGKVVEVNVEEGMSVREGQVLARLDDATYRASLALAEAQVTAAERQVRENEVRLEEARRTLMRATELLKGGFSTQADVDAADAEVNSLVARIAALEQQVEVARRQLELEETNLDNTIIRAPFSGVAISKDAQPGEMVSPVSAGGGFTRTGICTIVDMSSLEIEVDVNESYIGRVEAGQPVTAVLDAYPDWDIAARVITTVPTADRQKATVLVRIGFETSTGSGSSRATSGGALDSRILPDMGVKVTFLRQTGDENPEPAARPMALVPRTAVRGEGDQSFVFLIAVAPGGGDATAERRAVLTGGMDGDRMEVLAGLNPGDRVVVSPPPTLVDGARIVIR